MNPARKTSVNRELEDDDSDFSLISIYLFIVFFKWKYPDGAFLPQYFSNFTSVTQRGREEVVFSYSSGRATWSGSNDWLSLVCSVLFVYTTGSRRDEHTTDQQENLGGDAKISRTA